MVGTDYGVVTEFAANMIVLDIHFVRSSVKWIITLDPLSCTEQAAFK